ncbi:M15 family metallopeptidase [Mycobacterium shottsii]|uniref:M15 family metallopeptidase n=1 Tax=Mycobacterium shottsii TaxID=133549 RepID=UPI0018EA0977|nr:M15 family metallopeptidase [Mycobacterium shottsii]
MAADDQLSTQDNTSTLNCRAITGPGQSSPHAFGNRAKTYIDAAGVFQPKNEPACPDRGRSDAGLPPKGDPAVPAFADHGWRWGGAWTTPIGYQHFERRFQRDIVVGARLRWSASRADSCAGGGQPLMCLITFAQIRKR